MDCPYCHVSYSWEESCFCLPPLRAVNVLPTTVVNGEWGEATASWSLEPETHSTPAALEA